MKKTAVIPNLERDTDGIGTKAVIECLKKHGITPILDNSLKGLDFDGEFVDIDTCKSIDMAIIIGGDGTLLSNSRRYINTEIPVLGINHGHIGFLTELEKDDQIGLEEILDGNYLIDKRPVIKVTHHEEIHLSINEFTVYRGISPKMLDTEIIIDDVSMNKFKADGLIVSTSSGSTAYSMSAGGPIINPSVNAFVITPICPHNLYLRSVVVPTEAQIEIKLSGSETKCAVSVDGNLISELVGAHTIKLTKGGYLNTIRRDGKSFYKKLKTKFFEKEM